MIFIVLVIGACSYEEPTDKKEEEIKKVASVQIQVVGSLIEGLTVCYDKNNSCKQTNKHGMVEFDNFGTYSFKVRDMSLSKLKIDSNRTIVSPYTLFDKNETLAQRTILLLHAFDKSKSIEDEEVLLSLSSYISDESSVEELLAKTYIDVNCTDMNGANINCSDVSCTDVNGSNINYSDSNCTNIDSTDINCTYIKNSEDNSTEGNILEVLVVKYELLKYRTNDYNVSEIQEHNITINFTESNITRDGKHSHIVIPKKSSYETLNDVMKFVDLSVDKNVTIDNFEEKYLLTKNSLISFNLGDRYVVRSLVKEEHVVLEFFENSSRIKDETVLIVTDEDNVLSTSMLNLRFEDTEENFD